MFILLRFPKTDMPISLAQVSSSSYAFVGEKDVVSRFLFDFPTFCRLLAGSLSLSDSVANEAVRGRRDYRSTQFHCPVT